MPDYRQNPAKNIELSQKTKNLSTQSLTKINDHKKPKSGYP